MWKEIVLCDRKQTATPEVTQDLNKMWQRLETGVRWNQPGGRILGLKAWAYWWWLIYLFLFIPVQMPELCHDMKCLLQPLIGSWVTDSGWSLVCIPNSTSLRAFWCSDLTNCLLSTCLIKKQNWTKFNYQQYNIITFSTVCQAVGPLAGLLRRFWGHRHLTMEKNILQKDKTRRQHQQKERHNSRISCNNK